MPRKPIRRAEREEDRDLDLPSGAPGADELDENGNVIQPLIEPQGEDGDARLHRAADGQRRTGAVEDPERASDGGLASAQQEYDIFRDEWTQEALPKLPLLPGYHMCWLSTTNQWDPIPRRIRMGYTPVKPEEMPGFEHLTLKSGQYDGLIGINEMVLFKLPSSLYEKIMTKFHHEDPLNEEGSIKRNNEAFAADQVDSEGQALVRLEEGMQSLGKRPKRKPSFAS